MKFNFTLEPFVLKSTYAITFIDQILRSMNFETDKSLRYDPKRVVHQRKLDVNLKGYDADQDELLATLANTVLFEQIEVGDRSSNKSERSNPSKATKNQEAKVPTPLKGEKSLKRHSTEIVDMDMDVVTKKPRMSMQEQEIVDSDDDDERSINKGKATVIEEESHDQSQSVSNIERMIANLTVVESIQDPAIIFQKFAMDEAKTS